MKIRVYNDSGAMVYEQAITAGQSKDIKKILSQNKIGVEVCMDILNLFNQICIRLPKVYKLTDGRKAAIARAIKDGYNLEDIFLKVESSEFLCGNNARGWHADFDFILKPQNLAKIAESAYDIGDNAKNERNILNSSFDIDELDRHDLDRYLKAAEA